MNWTQWANAQLDQLRASNRARCLHPLEVDGVEGSIDGRTVISFASNDYLGLSRHPRVRHAAQAAIEKFGTGAGASRLIAGTRALHLELEAALAAYRRCARALVFPTGFAANMGVLSVFGHAQATIFSDALNHASIIDGCRLARARTLVYRHRDHEHLASLMAATRGAKIVVSDTVFSMDGDVAPVAALAELCVRHNALLVLDAAHAVLGPEISLDEVHCLQVGTLSKTLGSLGGWVAGPAALIELLINCARSFIFTTALSPADTAAALAALEICTGAEGEALRLRLRQSIDRLAPQHPSSIIPVMFGEERAALRASEYLLSQGLFVPAIRPPTVPHGTARLRIAVSTLHTAPMLARLQQALATYTSEPAASAIL